MKNYLLILSSLLLLTSNSFATKGSKSPNKKDSLTKTAISFTENKGQVYDQNFKPRADVLYSSMAGNMVLHIKKAGVSYQLNRMDKYKEIEDPRTREKRKVAEQSTVYRVDLNWINCNSDFKKEEDAVLPGYSNYYNDVCPNGALDVRSFKGVTLTNLYDGINLHYYEKNGELKHDYIVAPHADYKQIQIKVEGAKITVNKDGSLLLHTALGTIQEGAPLVFQNGKQLNASWQIKNNILSFVVQNYDSNYELIIDPVTRIWGTYYGGAGQDYGYHCTTDASGNVYMAGLTSGSAASVIATSGSHQSTPGGGLDGLLVKFDPYGIRLWATYYGGSVGGGSEYFFSCATDISGDVYACGETNTYVNSTVIATPGSHQPNFSGTNNNDAMLVKFNSNGVRQWGTYYGGTSNEIGFSCATDASGNVFMAGETQSSSNIASSGSHDATFNGGSYDAFLVKFNTSGVRQWGTYYGGSSREGGRSCATDAGGNVYLAGFSNSTSGIATSGAHQTVFGGATSFGDAYIVKFNAAGVRQWGSYYGTTLDDYAYACATDLVGNVYITGSAGASTNTIIATAAGHQTLCANSACAYLAKFDASGVRQWGTYYGGPGSENPTDCATDGNGNVYLAGMTTTSVGTTIATIGSYQSNYGGNGSWDGFLAKFSGAGVRQWGTYYGGLGGDQIEGCATDIFGNVFITGGTNLSTGTVIASNGSHQIEYGGGTQDAVLVKFDACDVAPTQPLTISGTTVLCDGFVTSFTTNVALNVSTYSLLMPNGLLGTSNSNTIFVTPNASGLFTLVTGNDCGLLPQQTISVTVNPTPTVSVSNGTICSGKSFTLMPSGASTYSYSNGQIVSPTVTTTYSITGTNVYGCYNATTNTVVVNTSPTVSVNSGSICAGGFFVIVPSGANFYNVTGSVNMVSPSVTTNYSVVGVSSLSCLSTNTAVSTVIVYSNPTINISASNSVICLGEESILTASGAVNYTFTPGGNNATLAVSPNVSTDYLVLATDVMGCKTTGSISVEVQACLGLNEINSNDFGIKLYPNPTSGIISVELLAETEITVMNALGQIVYAKKLNTGTHQINLEHLENGVYLVELSSGENAFHTKLVKE